MLKAVMLVSALAISAPVLAQEASDATQPQQKVDKKAQKTEAPSEELIKADVKTDPNASTDVAAAPAPAGDVSADVAATAETAPAPAAPAADQVAAAPAQPAQTPTAPVDVAQAQPDAAAPQQGQAVTGAAQIAQVISTEFPTYDGNKDGNLEKAEFGKWMVALKTASDPSTKANDPATVQWVSGAFAQADTDKSNNVSQAELTKFLTQGAD